MRTRLHGLAAVAVVFAAVGLPACGDNQDDGGARALYQRLQAESYTSWKRAPGYELRKASFTAHAETVEIFVNPVVDQALVTGEGTRIATWPEGSVIVKRGYSGRDLALVAVMEKRAGSWYWAEYDADGDPIYSGQPDICIDCHRRSPLDSVWSFGFRK